MCFTETDTQQTAQGVSCFQAVTVKLNTSVRGRTSQTQKIPSFDTILVSSIQLIPSQLISQRSNLMSSAYLYVRLPTRRFPRGSSTKFQCTFHIYLHPIPLPILALCFASNMTSIRTKSYTRMYFTVIQLRSTILTQNRFTR